MPIQFNENDENLSSACKIYFSKIFGEIKGEVYPLERQAEIDESRSEKVKLEKFTVWKLLEVAINDCFSKNISDFNFHKAKNGKWLTKEFYFSLSHTTGVACVAVSKTPVGIDVENLKSFQNKVYRKEAATFNKIATEKENTIYKNPSISLLSELWTKKEAIFKSGKKSVFMPSKIETGDYNAKTFKLNLFGEDYVTSVCVKDDIAVKYSLHVIDFL